MLESAKQCFNDQRYDGKRVLCIDDETGLGDPGSVPAKYNRMAEWIRNADILAVWEDDDTYLPDHLERIAAAWQAAGEPSLWWGHPSEVYSDYPGHVVTEQAAGRFHAAIALTVDAWRGCPWIETKRADFDQQWMAALREKYGPPCDYLAGGDPTYVFRWHTGHHHGQSTMRAPDDETWYERARQLLLSAAERDTEPVPTGYDPATLRVLAQVVLLRSPGQVEPTQLIFPQNFYSPPR